jgi:xanthosine utilization system XapX-like protein
MRSVCFVELLGTVSGIKILNVVQQCFGGEFMSLATIKHTYIYQYFQSQPTHTLRTIEYIDRFL